MKTSATTISFLLLLAISTFGVVLVSSEGFDVVYDADGDSVKTNVPYFISFMTIEYGMWICRMHLGSDDPESCPQQPVMFTNPNIAPTPVMFVLSSSTSSSEDRVVVNESTDLSVKFATPGHCGESVFWRVVQNKLDLDGEVFLNGMELSKDSTFTIQKTNEYYKFTFGYGIENETTISLSNEPIARLLSKRISGEMEIYFYKATR